MSIMFTIAPWLARSCAAACLREKNGARRFVPIRSSHCAGDTVPSGVG
jgi:hypothetical protein